MRRPIYTPGDQIRIVCGRNTGKTAKVVRVAAPVVEARIDGDRTYQLVTASIRLITQPQERTTA